MSLSWLGICQAVADELGLSRPTVIASATDDMSRQLGALANRVGATLVRRKEWTTLQDDWIITVAEPVTMTGSVTSGSAVVTGLSSTAGLAADSWVASGAYFVQQPRVVSVDSGTQVTLDTESTATGSTTLTFAKDTYTVPSDFLTFIDATMWDRTRRWQMIGPITPQEDQLLRSGIVAPVPRRRWRQIGRTSNSFRVFPPPTAVDAPASLVFNYISSNWAQDNAGTPKAQFTVDTDTTVFPDDIMVMGLKWHFMQTKGMDYISLRADWERQVGIAMAQDGGAADLSLTRRVHFDPADPASLNITIVAP